MEVFTCKKDLCTNKFIVAPYDFNGTFVLFNTMEPLQNNQIDLWMFT